MKNLSKKNPVRMKRRRRGVMNAEDEGGAGVVGEGRVGGSGRWRWRELVRRRGGRFGEREGLRC